MQTRMTVPVQPPAAARARAGAVHLRDVCKAFAAPRRGAAPVTALAGLTLAAQPGGFVGAVRPSGGGKTTLLELGCGLFAADAGTVDAAPAALMAQRDLLLPWASAIDNAALALRIGGGARAPAPG